MDANTPPPNSDLRVRYERALDDLVVTLKQDRTILAAALFGSLSYDTVWEKSDIDLVIVGDESHKQRTVALVEDGINIHAMLLPRSEFKRMIEGALQGSFMHSAMSKGRLLFTHDEAIGTMFTELNTVGSRDRAIQLLAAGCNVPPYLAKAQKWLHVRHDPHYSFVWILYCVNELARIEALSHGQIVGREAVQQALALNPAFFQSVYTDLIDGPKTEAAMQTALTSIESYMMERIPLLFQPLLDFLSESGGPRSNTEISAYFQKRMRSAYLDSACEWLADQGIIDKVGIPLRLSPKSRVAINEAAYYYDAG